MANKIRALASPVRMTSRGFPEQAVDEDVLAQGIIKVLQTALGERVRRPLFGSALHQLLFTNMGRGALARAQVEARRAIETWMQRVTVDQIIVSKRDSRIVIEVVWRVRGTIADARRTQVSFDVGT